MLDTSGFSTLVEHHGVVLVLLGLVLAIAFGAWHALLPGHGKTLMAAYMVGSETKVRQAVAVGGAVAVMHTASVVGLGLLVLGLEQTFRPEALYPWLGLLSGLVAMVLGAYLLICRLSAWSWSGAPPRPRPRTGTGTSTGNTWITGWLMSTAVCRIPMSSRQVSRSRRARDSSRSRSRAASCLRRAR